MLQADGATIILFLFSLVGAFTFCLWLWAKWASQLDWLTGLFVAFISVVTFTGWVGVVLASFGHFSLGGVTAVLLITSLLLAAWQRPFRRPTFQPSAPTDRYLVLLLILLAFLYFHPHEYIMGGADAGGYMNIAATLAQTGDFIIHDEWTPHLRQYPELTLRQQPAVWQTRYLQLVGWYIDDDDPSRLIPQFFPFHPVLLAIAMSVGGLKAGLWLTPLWGTIGLLAVYLLTRKLYDAPIGLLAVGLLGLTPTHIFFARYPTTEPLTLLLVFALLLVWQHLWDEEAAHPAWGVLGGLLVGAANLTRIDLPVLVILLVFWGGVRWWLGRWSRAWTMLGATAVPLLLHAILSAIWLNWPYTWNTYGSVFRLLQSGGVVTAVFLAALPILLIALMAWWQGGLQPANLARFSQAAWLRWLLVIGIINASLFAYFVRPILQPALSYPTWPGGQTIPLLDGENWVRLGWYLTPLGLALATGGLCWLVLRRFDLRSGLFLSVGVLMTVQYVYRIFNTPYHIYAMRRYVPVIIPVLMIYAAAALLAISRTKVPPNSLQFPPVPRSEGNSGQLRATSRLYSGISLALTALLLLGLVYQSRFVLPRTDYAGAISQLTAFHNLLQPDALIIICDPPESIFADRIGTPLRFLWGHDVATIRTDGPELADFVQEMKAYAVERQRPLQLIAINPIPTAVRQLLTLQPVTMSPIRLDMLQNTFTDYPSVRQTLYYGIEIYDVVESGGETAVTPLSIDIGTLDTAYIASGFYYKEQRPGDVTMRWTQTEALIEIPAYPGEINIEVRAKIFRPETVIATPVTVWLDGDEIGQFTPDNTWQTYTFSGQTSPANSTSTLQFNSVPFTPADLGINNDTRSLGFLLDWVRIK
ncbi:MAG: glycosyltransferase family 39 protein [Ardenticatenaceae bacterium]|nr:glycosyltransferase family 39 protein [Ardenticatenaceae bacterium]